ncbi:hypothetical protein POP12_199 [Pectobacterium phage POP12]|nr:hypothetical protein POP12_199 [Pectobacterium phage POP12]
MTLENELRKFDILDEKALSDYLELVSNPDTEGYTELHHICPKSMFPEYIKSGWNLVALSYDRHRLAHKYLVLMYQNGNMKRAYSFMMRNSYDEKIKSMTSGAFLGDKNPAKRNEVREKIRISKLGKKRDDIKGKRYFGANQETIDQIAQKSSESLRNTVIVKDSEGNKFRVDIKDPRYVSGDLVPFNLGESRPNSASKRPDVISKIMETRTKTYMKYETFTFEQMVDFLVSACENGKNVLGKKRLFGRNYSTYVKMSKHPEQDIYDSVVQRLSKGA